MEEREIWINLAALAAWIGTLAYALFGGADFGGGVWDLCACGPRRREQRLAIQHAMGPVWEANHVWLIFVLVVLFTCFPRGYAALAVALFVPFHLLLLGIMLRGASFVFRTYSVHVEAETAEPNAWGAVFGVASIITPVLLGAAFGVLTEGSIRLKADGNVELTRPWPWLTPYCLLIGLLALSTCAYLAAVYLTNETDGELREDFRWRAIIAGTTTAVLAGIVLLLTRIYAFWFWEKIWSLQSLPVMLAGLVCFAGSAWSVFQRRYALSRIFAIGEITLILFGWGLAQRPYLIYPDVIFSAVAAPTPTLRFLILSLIPGSLVLVPSLILLFVVFKSERTKN